MDKDYAIMDNTGIIMIKFNDFLDIRQYRGG